MFLFVTHLPLRGLLLLRLGYFLRFFEVSSLVSRGIFAQGSHSSVEWPWLARIFCLFCHSLTGWLVCAPGHRIKTTVVSLLTFVNALNALFCFAKVAG